MKNLLSCLFFIFLMISFFSCVPSKKYQDTVTSRDALTKEKKELISQNQALQNENLEMLEDLNRKNKQIDNLEQDTAIKGDRYRSIQALSHEVERLYRQILAQNESLIANSSSDKREMTESVASLQTKLNQMELEMMRKEGEIVELKRSLGQKTETNLALQGNLEEREATVKKLEADLKVKETELGKLKRDLEIREARVSELEQAINRQNQQANALKDKLNSALLGFSQADLSVEQRNGKVYVSLSQQLLFATGSKTMDAKGKDAIKSLASVLNNNPDIAIAIEGHTDDVGDAASNWDLSVLRATTIVKELTGNGVDPKRITASGRGEHYPIASNETSAGKAKNRRTEIILSPNLKELFDILNQ